MLKSFIKRIVYGKKYSSETYVDYLRSIGIKIGNNCRIFSPINTVIDEQNPKLISIGDNVRITQGVNILTHDYSWSVLAVKYNQCFGNIGPVIIGNNVFIGINSVILKNSNIGDNVIIGAGSVVSGNILSNSVYVGNPAKRIMSIEEFYNKMLGRQCKDIVTIFNTITASNRKVEEKDFFEYFYKFVPYKDLLSNHLSQINKTGNGANILNNYNNDYDSFDSMIADLCLKKENTDEEEN